MPIYEYQCTSCHHHFDLMQKINEEPAKQCPKCMEDALVKLVSAAGFQLKGTGWYATDFKDKSSSSSQATKASTDTTKDSAATKPAETTPSTKGTTE